MSFYKCDFFEEDFQLDLAEEKSFTVNQEEITLHKKYLSPNAQLAMEQVEFEVGEVEYNCAIKVADNFSSSKPCVLIPIKDNAELLTVTSKNLKDHKISEHCNVCIIDDRSSNESIKQITLDNNFTYLRVDNSKGFNFSMLNNICAKAVHALGASSVILWNSDLWCPSEEVFLSWVKKHTDSGAQMSGAKLVYPPIEMSLDGKEDTANITNNPGFTHVNNGRWRNTVQFGGDMWYPAGGIVSLVPHHYLRFANPEDSRVNCDRGSSFITGALQFWDLNQFIEIGGLNPSLSKNFQDVDACLKLLETGSTPMYFGKETFFYHDESVSLEKEGKRDFQIFSDQVLFGKIWNKKVLSLVYGM